MKALELEALREFVAVFERFSVAIVAVDVNVGGKDGLDKESSHV